MERASEEKQHSGKVGWFEFLSAYNGVKQLLE